MRPRNWNLEYALIRFHFKVDPATLTISQYHTLLENLPSSKSQPSTPREIIDAHARKQAGK